MKFLFYSPLKVTADNDDVLFWSDAHFGHRCDSWPTPLWKMRGFDSVEEHDEALISRWNDVASDASVAFHLGDFIFGNNTIGRFEETICKLQFDTLYMMPGNHCSGWKQWFEKQQQNVWNIAGNKRVIFVPNYLEAIINGQPIVMSHYPLVSFNGQAIGSWMIHGHCHSKLYSSEIGNELYKAKVLDVGVENSPAPKTFTQLKHFFDAQPNKCFDSYGETKSTPKV